VFLGEEGQHGPGRQSPAVGRHSPAGAGRHVGRLQAAAAAEAGEASYSSA